MTDSKGFLSPGCSWSWPHWRRLVPVCSGRCAERARSTPPPPGTSPGSDTAAPSCLAAWPRLDGLCPEPEEGCQETKRIIELKELFSKKS